LNFTRHIFYLLAGPAIASAASLLIGAVFILGLGKNPLDVYGLFFAQTFGSGYGIGQVLFKATPLMFTGLAAALSFRAGLFNIGAEGQLTVGAFLTALVGFLGDGLSPLLLIPAALLAGMAGGALWGLVPGILKARFGSHEVINTIMMNFIALALVSYLVSNVFFVPASVHTPHISEAAGIPRLESVTDQFRGAPVNFSLLLALGACLLIYFLLWKTRPGYELRATGLNRNAALYGGIHVPGRIIFAMTLSGALAGLVGSNFVLGYKHYFELGFSEGIGFIGIAVALLAKNHPLGIIATAIFFGILEYGSLTINTLVPKELANILQAIIIIFVIILTKIANRWLLRFQPQPVPEAVHG
jgi:general nucleoside transport system permease protein